MLSGCNLCSLACPGDPCMVKRHCAVSAVHFERLPSFGGVVWHTVKAGSTQHALPGCAVAGSCAGACWTENPWPKRFCRYASSGCMPLSDAGLLLALGALGALGACAAVAAAELLAPAAAGCFARLSPGLGPGKGMNTVEDGWMKAYLRTVAPLALTLS